MASSTRIQEGSSSILLRDYMQAISLTDKLPHDDFHSVLMGLFGEVGSVMATVKKTRREKEAYAGFQIAVEEEFGDTLWYFSALCRRLGIGVDEIFSVAAGEATCTMVAASDLAAGPVAHVASFGGSPSHDQTLAELGVATAGLLHVKALDEQVRGLLREFGICYLRALQISQVPFSNVVRRNIEKATGRFLAPVLSQLPNFDREYLEEERLPLHFEIKFTQRKSGQSYLQWNGVFLGDPLTDNIMDPDGYRFHDTFHLAHAAILHWSPVFRALIKHKRKSERKVDEAQDGGRAIVVEEGLTAWIFARAKQSNFFNGQNSLSFDLLKTVHQFVQGYEVDTCPLSLWERAIIDGYAVFKLVHENNGGVVVGDRDSRTISYKPADGG
jgi:NTP pyrophosphatase (non-canonical NTP hydrolase)